MSEPRIISPAEALEMLTMAQGFNLSADRETLIQLAYTAAVLGEQRDAVLALHQPNEHGDCGTCRNKYDCYLEYPCLTARALGVKS
jgi:hypothetical protein